MGALANLEVSVSNLSALSLKLRFLGQLKGWISVALGCNERKQVTMRPFWLI